MFKNPARHLNRTGCEPVRFLFTIRVIDLILPNQDPPIISLDSIVSVCFERGAKISSTSNKIFNNDNINYLSTSIFNVDKKKKDIVKSKVILPFDEKVELMATLYKDSKTGKYQEKKGKVILRQYQKNKLFSIDSFKGLGLYSLKLDEFVKNLGYDNCKSIELDLPLEQMTETYLKVVITTTLLKPTELNEETISLGSCSSDASAIGANFSSSDFDNSLNYYDNNGNEDMPKLQLNRMSTSFEEEDLFSKLNMKEYSSSQRFSTGIDGIKQRINNDAQNELVTKQEEIIKSNEETFKLYQNELENRAMRIKKLEIQVSTQSEQIINLKTENNKLKTMDLNNNNNNSGIEYLLDPSRTSISSPSNSMSDLQIALDQAREDVNTMATEYSRKAEELSIMSDSMLHYKAVAEDAIKEKEEETLAAQEAATGAVIANMKRAELEKEVNGLIAELIDMKVKYADLANDLESERKKRYTTKIRLQQYAERVTLLEVQLSNRLENNILV